VREEIQLDEEKTSEGGKLERVGNLVEGSIN
jgi:hypothetical protein